MDKDKIIEAKQGAYRSICNDALGWIDFVLFRIVCIFRLFLCDPPRYIMGKFKNKFNLVQKGLLAFWTKKNGPTLICMGIEDGPCTST